MDKCPFCGANKLKEPQYAMDYECGHIDKTGFRHEVCAMRQIANLTERLEERGKKIANLEDRLIILSNEYDLELEGNRTLSKELEECRERLGALGKI